MATANKVLMDQAKESLKGRWAQAIFAGLQFGLVSGILNALSKIESIGFVFSLIGIFIAGYLYIGLARFSVKFSRKENINVKDFMGIPISEIYPDYQVFENYLRGFKASFWKFVYTFFWYLLLIVPGIIKSISYSQFYYILAEDKNIDIREALKKSKDMMEGNKMKYFKLCLRFIPWGLLCLLTLGIGFIWLLPWMEITMVKFYDDVKGNTGPVASSTPEATPIAQPAPVVAEVVPAQA